MHNESLVKEYVSMNLKSKIFEVHAFTSTVGHKGQLLLFSKTSCTIFGKK